MMTSDERRFWSKVETGQGCWLWTGATNGRGGYGRFRLNRETIGAHRAVFILAGVSIPAGKVVKHSCDNVLCVRPDHLSIGTQAENMQDWRDHRPHYRKQRSDCEMTGAQLRRRRLDLGMSIQELASKLPVAFTTLQKWETDRPRTELGRRGLDPMRVARLEQVLDELENGAG